MLFLKLTTYYANTFSQRAFYLSRSHLYRDTYNNFYYTLVNTFVLLKFITNLLKVIPKKFMIFPVLVLSSNLLHSYSVKNTRKLLISNKKGFL